MTEEEWLFVDDPLEMIDFLRTQPESLPDRKFRLWACAAYRQEWSRLNVAGMQRAIDTAELLADGMVTETVRALSQEEVVALKDVEVQERGGGSDLYWEIIRLLGREYDGNCAFSVARWLGEGDGATSCGRLHAQLIEEQGRFVRDTFGNPFRPVAFTPRWRTADVVGLARGIYEDRAFERMPLLADALMDAGCDDEQILGHCRGEGPHVRGCWVVDLVLDKH